MTRPPGSATDAPLTSAVERPRWSSRPPRGGVKSTVRPDGESAAEVSSESVRGGANSSVSQPVNPDSSPTAVWRGTVIELVAAGVGPQAGLTERDGRLRGRACGGKRQERLLRPVLLNRAVVDELAVFGLRHFF